MQSTLKHHPPSAHALAARAACERKRVPSPDELIKDELIKEIYQKIAEKGHLRTINNATLTELDEMLEHGNELAKLWEQ